MLRQIELVERVKAYDPTANEELLNKAYVFAMKAHSTQVRESGDPYFSHPLEVAGILTRWKLDSATIATALLHDTVEDTLATMDEIRSLFGEEIAFLVDGVTKLSKIELVSDQSKQAENFRKLVLAMSKDLRVLLVKLADRLHNMRTLGYVKSLEKRERISRETIEIYAPLAERIGMHEMRNELEDLAFSYLNTETHALIVARLEFMRKKGEDLITRVIEQLREVLTRGELHVSISGREKTPYSIWRKIQKKNVEFEQLSDIMAFRIVVPTVAECYQALGIIHSTYSMIPGRFKDYISTAKFNGYQSLHTTVIGPENQRIEIQIRTDQMHDIAEMGVAAHWQYKDGKSRKTKTEASSSNASDGTDGVQYRWLRGILDILEHASGPEEFLEHTKLEMFPDQVFCFTPQGDLISLPKGATPVDFAYAVHSEIGDHCVGVKINNRLMPLRTSLSNGDQVEIITAKNHVPSKSWERFVVTGKARARIRRYVHTQERKEYLDLGRSLLNKSLRKIGLSYSEETVEALAKRLKYLTLEDFLISIGEGTHLGRDVAQMIQKDLPQKSQEFTKEKNDLILNNDLDKDQKKYQASALKRKASQQKREKEVYFLPIRGLISGMAIHYAGCCHPLPGESIVGIVTTGKGVTIHTTECLMLKSHMDNHDRWIDVSWDEERDKSSVYIGRIKVNLLHEPGSMGAFTTSLGAMGANIENLKVTNRCPEFHEFLVDIEVRDIEHLKTIIANLRTTKAVHSVDRA